MSPYSPNAPPVSTPLRSPRAQRQGALYRISRDGRRGYLFGTVHVGAQSFYPLAPEVDNALADATQLVLELDTRANDAFQRALIKYATYAGGDSVAAHISPATLARLQAALRDAGLEFEQVAHLKPWLIANLLVGLELQRSGFDRNHGLESFLLAQVSQRGTAVVELESADYQLALYDTLDETRAARYLDESLAELANGTSWRRSKAMIDAWQSGETGALNALLPDATSGDTVASEFMRRMLLGKRNPEMAARIERLMDDGRTSFVGVGLLHLLGDDGLPQLLAQRGYQVERMY